MLLKLKVYLPTFFHFLTMCTCKIQYSIGVYIQKEDLKRHTCMYSYTLHKFANASSNNLTK